MRLLLLLHRVTAAPCAVCLRKELWCHSRRLCIRESDRYARRRVRGRRGHLAPEAHHIRLGLTCATAGSPVALGRIRIPVWLRSVPGLPGLGVGHGLECPGGLESLVCVLLLHVPMQTVLDSQTRSVECCVCSNLDGHFVLNDGRDSVFGPGCDGGIGTHGSHAESNDANGAAEGHAAHDVPLPRIVSGAVLLQVSFDDRSLLPGVVDGRRGHANTDK